LSLLNLIGSLLIIGGIALVIAKKKDQNLIDKKISLVDLGPALLASLGQAGGVILSKLGMVSLDPLSATQIRLIGGLVGMVLLISFLRNWKELIIPNTNKDSYIAIGYVSIVGTFIAVFLSMIAIKNAPAAVASVLMSTQPVLILPISWLLTKQKVQLVEVIGACMTLLGVSLLI